MSNKDYIAKAIPTKITASSRASIKIRDQYYTFEYSEERSIENFDEVDLDEERRILWKECNEQVDSQIDEIVNTYQQR